MLGTWSARDGAYCAALRKLGSGDLAQVLWFGCAGCAAAHTVDDGASPGRQEL